jgi:hypothetical protein
MIIFSDKTHDRQLDFGFFSALSHVEVTYMLTERRRPVGLTDMLFAVDRVLGSAGVFGNGSVRVVPPQGEYHNQSSRHSGHNHSSQHS